MDQCPNCQCEKCESNRRFARECVAKTRAEVAEVKKTERCACDILHEQDPKIRAEVIREMKARGLRVGPPFDIPGGRVYYWSRTFSWDELDSCLNWQEVMGLANTFEKAGVDGVKPTPKPFFAHPFEENRAAVSAGYFVFRLIAPVEGYLRRIYLAVTRRGSAER